MKGFFDNWTSTTTYDKPETPANIDVQYKSKDRTYFGIQTISVSKGDKRVYVKAKFDTGARSSSIDFSIAKELGFSNELIARCKELEKVAIPRTMKRDEQLKLEKKFTTELQKDFPEIVNVQGSRSSSGFSIRAYVRLNIEFDGKVVITDVNLRDRTGLSCEMLVGLKDMI